MNSATVEIEPAIQTGEEFTVVVEEARLDLLCYTQYCDPTYQWSALAEIISDRLAKLGSETKRLVISVPPRHGKSRLVSIEWASWMMGKRPGVEIVLASYSAELAKEHSRRARDRVRTEEWRNTFSGVDEDPEQSAAGNWRLTNGSTFQAVGVGGSLTGRGADILLIDDPVKDHAEAASKTIRDNVWNWFLSVALTRLSPTGVVVIIMTRWHVDDLVGRVLDKERQSSLEEAGGKSEVWDELKLPALAEEKDPLHRQIGEALWPERYNREYFQPLKKSSAYIFSSLYQQNPVPAEGNVVDRASFKIVEPSALPKEATRMRYWDLAASESDLGNYWAGARGCIGPDGTFYVEDVERFRRPWQYAKGRILETTTNEKIAVGIEAVGGFKIAYQELRNSLPPDATIREYGADSDKLTRALPWFALAGNGKVALLRGAWNEDFLSEVHAFPMGAFDDQVDAVSGLYIMLKTSFGKPWALPPKPGASAEAWRMTSRRTVY